ESSGRSGADRSATSSTRIAGATPTGRPSGFARSGQGSRSLRAPRTPCSLHHAPPHSQNRQVAGSSRRGTSLALLRDRRRSNEAKEPARKTRKTNDRRRKRSAPRDLSAAKAAGVKGGLLPAVNQLTAVPAVQMGDGSVRNLAATVAEKH